MSRKKKKRGSRRHRRASLSSHGRSKWCGAAQTPQLSTTDALEDSGGTSPHTSDLSKFTEPVSGLLMFKLQPTV